MKLSDLLHEHIAAAVTRAPGGFSRSSLRVFWSFRSSASFSTHGWFTSPAPPAKGLSL